MKSMIRVADMVRVYFIPVDDIVFFESKGSYTIMYMIDSNQVVLSKCLKTFYEQVKGRGFFRIHKSYVVNLQHMKSFHKGNGNILMQNGKEIKVAKRRRSLFMSLLNRYDTLQA